MGRMKEQAIIKDREQGYCPTVELLLSLAEADGGTADDIHCKCEVCTSQDPEEVSDA